MKRVENILQNKWNYSIILGKETKNEGENSKEYKLQKFENIIAINSKRENVKGSCRILF